MFSTVSISLFFKDFNIKVAPVSPIQFQLKSKIYLYYLCHTLKSKTERVFIKHI